MVPYRAQTTLVLRHKKTSEQIPIRILTTVSSKRYGNLRNLSGDFTQNRIRHLSRAAPETVQRATHAFAAPIENMGINHVFISDSVPFGEHQGWIDC